MPQYTVNNTTVDNLLGSIKNHEISIPEIQRPFVWQGDQIRDLIDSLYNGYPIGYIIIWKNPDTLDKNGEKTLGKKIMIDGQQRITALMTSIVGMHIIDKNFNDKVHKISFNPFAAKMGEPCFQVQTPIILKDKRWIKDISYLFSNDYNSFTFIPEFCKDNPEIDNWELNQIIEKVRDIRNAPIGVINLNQELSIDKVTEIFIRINSKGSSLTQADFVMSTLAADEKYGGNELRKAIDYFCHLFADSKFRSVIEKDEKFIKSKYYERIKWVQDTDKELFKLSFDDVLRIAFSSRYYRGKMANLTDLLHGRNFNTRKFEDEIMEETFKELTIGCNSLFDKYTYNQFVECLKGAGFVLSKLVKGRMSLVFAYVLFIRLRNDQTIDKSKVSHYVQRWYVMSLLTSRYTSSPETFMDADLRSIREKGFLPFYDEVMANIADTFWNVTLVQNLETTSTASPVFSVFQAAQCKDVSASFLSVGSKVRDLLLSGDIHHIFPKQYLKDNNMDSVLFYNQIANYTYLSKPVNIAIGKQSPQEYLQSILNSIKNGEESKYTTIKSEEDLLRNFAENAIPNELINMVAKDYDEFLKKRRQLMANRIKDYYYSL